MPARSATRRSVYACVDPFCVFRNGIPEMYAAGREVLDDDPILRTHGHAFVDVAARIEAATAAPGERRSVTIPDHIKEPTDG